MSQKPATLPLYTPLARPLIPLQQFQHRQLQQGPFWQKIPAYAHIDETTFLDHAWQSKNSLTKAEKLVDLLQGKLDPVFYQDVQQGLQHAPMSIRISPYVLSLIDWESPYTDPLRIQFLPLHSQRLPDHPCVGLDSLAEQDHSPVPGLVHRYPDKALFLALDTCPVYCRFCTRSYAVGLDTQDVEKVNFRANVERWQPIFAYIMAHPELEDIVISGGDVFQLRPQQIREIGETLLRIPHIRRLRYATKGLAVMPQKIITDVEWLTALTYVVDMGRKLHKEVVMHTHFNHPNEITWITQAATHLLMERGIVVRNQSVLLRNVNDSLDTMQLLVRRLAYVNVHPYYVYVHDLVQGVEDLRTSVDAAMSLEKNVRGVTAGFHTPTFVVDAPGGGGKRDVHSCLYYDRTTGISIYESPAVRPGALFCQFDPLHALSIEGQRRWSDASKHRMLVEEALLQARQNLK